MKRTNTIQALGGACALGLLACGAATAPASPPPVAKAAPSANAPAAAATAAAAPTRVANPTTAARAASPFNVIGELPGELSLYGAGERGFLLSQAGIELELIGDEIVQDPLLKRGLPTSTLWISVDAVGGRYPDAFWLSTTQPQGRSGFSTLWKWDGKNWQKKEAFSESHYITGIQPWVGGRMLALEQANMLFEAQFHVLSGDTRVPLPELTKGKLKGDFSYCVTQLKPDAWVTLPTGEVIAAGSHCDPEQPYQELAVERWAAGARRSSIDIMPGIHEPGDLPSVTYTAAGVAALSPNDVFVAAWKEMWSPDQPTKTSSYFAHFDGKTWQAQPSPIPGGISALWTEPGGVIFASSERDELWSRGADGKWSAVVWPASITASGTLKLLGLWPHAPGDTWAVVEVTIADKSRTRYLLHTRPAVNQIPTFEALDRKDRSLRLPGPPVEWCTTRFVLLYTLGRQAPADYDYPATRKALKGHTEFENEDTKFVEFEREGRRYFGARVPDFTLGEKLARLVKDKVPGSTPELVCLDPLESRTLNIDLRTGALRPK